MENLNTANLGRIVLSPHRWRLLALVWFSLCAVNPVVDALREAQLTGLVLTQGLLIVAFGLGGWFGVIPLLNRFGTRPLLAVGLWLLPIFALAGVSLALMSTMGEGPLMLYVAAPILRLTLPKREEMLPKGAAEWVWESLVLALLLATLIVPWGEIITRLIMRRYLPQS